MPSRLPKHPIELPNHLSDESAAEILEFLYTLTETFESLYYAQIRRYDDNLRADMMSTKTSPRDLASDRNADDTDPPF